MNGAEPAIDPLVLIVEEEPPVTFDMRRLTPPRRGLVYLALQIAHNLSEGTAQQCVDAMQAIVKDREDYEDWR